jgi:hypothetical protein
MTIRVPGSRQRACTVTNTPNPLTVAMVGALDVARGLALAGMLGNRIVGMKGDAGVSYRGDLGPLQTFRGWSGPPRSLMPGAAMSLPLTGAPDPATGPFKARR